MSGTTQAPYGTWKSPVTASVVVEGSMSIDDVLVDPVTSCVYHIEKRPSEGGRNVLVSTKRDGDVFGKEWNARTAVHEYGGGAAIVRDGIAYFSNMRDGRVYKMEGGGIPQPVTPEKKAHRYANFSIHPVHTSLLVAVLEDHTHDKPSTVHNEICVINTTTQGVSSLISGADFYASVTFSPDGTRIAWQQWFHPDMPWEGAEIHVADVRVGNDSLHLSNSIHIAGKRGTVSVSYPSWVSNNTLVFTSDESGYQNPWVYSPGPHAKARPVFRVPVAQDFGGPAWKFGSSPFAPIDKAGERLVFVAMKDGRNILYGVDLRSDSAPQEIECPFAVIQSVRQVPRKPELVFVGFKVNESPGLVHCLFTSVAPFTPTYAMLKSTASGTFTVSSLSPDLVSIPQPISLLVSPNNEPLHVVFYPPANPAYSGTSLPGELPPCVVNVHGGPTSISGQGLSWGKTFYTSRGWAWLDVNYGGSSGYGRMYIDRLKGKWGIVDVNDCILAARTLSSAPYNLIDPSRMVIRGSSAGGFTVLAALSIAPVVTTFAAGTSSYGVSDLRKLGEETHKFESHYIEKLIGGTVDEVPEVYEERSPVVHAGRIVAPLLILQGENDNVVPKGQAEYIVKSIGDRGGHVEYHLYKGEGHGWRQAENIADALEREIKFYENVLHIKL